MICQKAPSAKKCIKACKPAISSRRAATCQKAPSAKRCIKTKVCRSDGHGFTSASQKEPSAKRCIKTFFRRAVLVEDGVVRKHRAPKGALRRRDGLPLRACRLTSESTERQTVH